MIDFKSMIEKESVFDVISFFSSLKKELVTHKLIISLSVTDLMSSVMGSLCENLPECERVGKLWQEKVLFVSG